MEKCYLVVHNAQNQHVVAVCKGQEAAANLAGRLNQRAGIIIYKIIEKEFIW